MDTSLILVVLGAAAAGFVQGLSGTAFSMVALPFWVWAVAPQLAGPMAAFGSLVGQLLAVRAIGRGFSLRLVAPFIAGGVIGVPLGVWLLPQVEANAFKAGLGFFLAVWCPVMLLTSNLPRITYSNCLVDGIVGWIGGTLGGLSGLAGAVPTLWCTMRDWNRDTQRAVFQSFNLTMHVLTLTGYAAGGLLTTEAVGWFAVIAPAQLIPALIGLWLYSRINDMTFRRIVLFLLSASGVALLGSSLPYLLGR